MHLFTSNRLENLLEHLAEIIRDQPLPPLQKETIVVQSQGMERWLSMALAQRLGIWANGEFPFPGAITWRLFRTCLKDIPDVSAYDPACLQWTVMKLLPDYLPEPAFTDLRHYLRDDSDGLKRYQLAQRIADTFDQYVVYRPDWIQEWEQESPAHWQAMLWNGVRTWYATRDTRNYTHRAALWQRLQQRLYRGDFEQSRLPQRLSVFGIASLPPFYTALFDELSKYIPVYLFIMNPCREYWGLIKSDAEIARISLRSNPPLDPEEEYLETGNPLLASMGKLGRDFLDMLTEYNPQEIEVFDEHEADTLLTRLQSDILELRDTSSDAEKYLLAPDDRSLQIHNCHSPMREVEVLHDQLLALFEADPDLTPGDVLVMTPDIEPYAPLIQAVFEKPLDAVRSPDEAQRNPGKAPDSAALHPGYSRSQSRKGIPFSIADRGARSEFLLYDAFFNLLALADSRLTLAEVLELLQVPALQARFELTPAELENLQTWLEAAGVRWGVDGADRAAQDLPAFRENTWRFGLERLLLGYALPGDGETLFEGILPFDGLEGGESLALGKFLDFAEALFSLHDNLRQARTLPAWQDYLLEILEDFFAPPGGDSAIQQQLQGLRNAISGLETQIVPAEFDEAVGPRVIVAWLQRYLEERHAPSGFITGSVTFCAMLPMRSIPFKLICLIGLHDRAYPRVRKAPGFDLMARRPRRGDRSRRHDDRYLFLESLLSARRYLYLSYAGQSIQDNSEIPPSVLISELLHYVEQSCVSADEGKISEVLVTKHPLQAFSHRYFDASDPKLFSYAAEHRAAAAALSTEDITPPPFFSAPLPKAADMTRDITLGNLLAFFRNPARYLVEQRLDMRLEGVDPLPEEVEPFAVAGLERYQMDQTLVEKILHSDGETDYRQVFKAAGDLPLGQVGDYTYDTRYAQATAFSERLKPLLADSVLEPLETALRLDSHRLSGRVAHARNNAWVQYRPATVKPTDLLSLWLHHLFLNATRVPGYPLTSLHVGLDRTIRLPPLKDSRTRLKALLAVYSDGLCQPARFFPATSYVYAEALHKGKKPDAALQRAEQSWLGSDWQRGDSDDLYFRLCFRDAPPLGGDFQELAEMVFGPVLKHIE